jgi:hypothetical protein
MEKLQKPKPLKKTFRSREQTFIPLKDDLLQAETKTIRPHNKWKRCPEINSDLKFDSKIEGRDQSAKCLKHYRDYDLVQYLQFKYKATTDKFKAYAFKNFHDRRVQLLCFFSLVLLSQCFNNISSLTHLIYLVFLLLAITIDCIYKNQSLVWHGIDMVGTLFLSNTLFLTKPD